MRPIDSDDILPGVTATSGAWPYQLRRWLRRWRARR